MKLTRREAIGGIAAAGLIPPLSAAAADDGLRVHATANNRFYGAAVDIHSVRTNHGLMNCENTECALLGGEDCFKWVTLHPAPNVYNYKDGDALVKYAGDNGKSLRGHTFLWYKGMPGWLTKTLNRGNAEQILTSHIENVLTHYQGRMLHWDVANEVIEPDDNQPGGFRNSQWYQLLGPQMLDIAFQAAATYDPTTTLTLNEYGLDYSWDPHKRRREAVLELLSSLKSRNVPVQALGIQAHLEAGVRELDQNILRQFCSDVASLGVKIIVTELDVRDNRITGDIPTRDAAVADQTSQYLDAMLDCPDVTGVVTWGLSDIRTWLNKDYHRPDGLPQRPLPLDDQFNRKPMWHAIAQAFDSAPAANLA